jgi:hypothetical protein
VVRLDCMSADAIVIIFCSKRHADNTTFGLLLQGLATSPNITGPYTFVQAVSPPGNWSEDFGMFIDRDGEAYALYSTGDTVAGRDDLISKMNSERTNLTEIVYTLPSM